MSSDNNEAGKIRYSNIPLARFARRPSTLRIKFAPFPLAHTARLPNGCCVDCWAKIKPGKPAVLVSDELPHTATTTGGV